MGPQPKFPLLISDHIGETFCDSLCRALESARAAADAERLLRHAHRLESSRNSGRFRQLMTGAGEWAERRIYGCKWPLGGVRTFAVPGGAVTICGPGRLGNGARFLIASEEELGVWLTIQIDACRAESEAAGADAQLLVEYLDNHSWSFREVVEHFFEPVHLPGATDVCDLRTLLRHALAGLGDASVLLRPCGGDDPPCSPLPADGATSDLPEAVVPPHIPLRCPSVQNQQQWARAYGQTVVYPYFRYLYADHRCRKHRGDAACEFVFRHTRDESYSEPVRALLTGFARSKWYRWRREHGCATGDTNGTQLKQR